MTEGEIKAKQSAERASERASKPSRIDPQAFEELIAQDPAIVASKGRPRSTLDSESIGDLEKVGYFVIGPFGDDASFKVARSFYVRAAKGSGYRVSTTRVTTRSGRLFLRVNRLERA
jgi:hypothetical protein